MKPSENSLILQNFMRFTKIRKIISLQRFLSLCMTLRCIFYKIFYFSCKQWTAVYSKNIITFFLIFFFLQNQTTLKHFLAWTAPWHSSHSFYFIFLETLLFHLDNILTFLNNFLLFKIFVI
jgi:hypothetical protein